MRYGAGGWLWLGSKEGAGVEEAGREVKDGGRGGKRGGGQWPRGEEGIGTL